MILQTRLVHIIVSGLLEREALSDNPRTVEMTREGYTSIFPCGSFGGPKLDLSQLEWALKEGKWWFLGPIKQLKVSDVKKSKLSHADLLTFKRLAIYGNFELVIIYERKRE